MRNRFIKVLIKLEAGSGVLRVPVTIPVIGENPLKIVETSASLEELEGPFSLDVGTPIDSTDANRVREGFFGAPASAVVRRQSTFFEEENYYG